VLAPAPVNCDSPKDAMTIDNLGDQSDKDLHKARPDKNDLQVRNARLCFQTVYHLRPIESARCSASSRQIRHSRS
jgi:hypothetical protein